VENFIYKHTGIGSGDNGTAGSISYYMRATKYSGFQL